MLDTFEILTTSGVVLWSKTYAPIGPSIINSLIRDVFIEERAAGAVNTRQELPAAQNPPYKKDKYTLKWTLAKDLGLIFVAVYNSLLHLSWIDRLLDNVKTLFVGLYGEQFRKPNTSSIECPFDDYFDRQIGELDKAAGTSVGVSSTEPSSPGELTPPSSTGLPEVNGAPDSPPTATRSTKPTDSEDNTSTDVTPIATPESSRPATPSSHIITAKSGPGGKQSRRARKAANLSASGSREGSVLGKKDAAKAQAKKGRKWGDDGGADDDEARNLDYSGVSDGSTAVTPAADIPAPEMIAQSSWSTRTRKGEVVLKDLDDEMASILSSAQAKKDEAVAAASSGGLVNSGLGAISGLFRNVVGGKQLSEDDLAKPLKGMEDFLVEKNVAREAAVRLSDAVKADLVGTRTASFQSVETTIRQSMEKALTKILTPTTSLDLLRAINAQRSASASAPPGQRRPYVMSIVGVNGVGKSTTLAKLAFLFLHNNLRVLVVGADTFRSGAVEQLRVHVRNLQNLTQNEQLGRIDLYERGYGKDPAHIARDAVVHASSADPAEAFDVVLIDTAGRRHNDTRLMSSLANFAKLAQPDKILMVGEALVGSDSVAQARHFNASFGPGHRGLDGIIVSKCDAVGGMVGTIVSMVHATGVPVVAVGVGQHYGDLRTLSVEWCTKLLMQ